MSLKVCLSDIRVIGAEADTNENTGYILVGDFKDHSRNAAKAKTSS